MSAFEQAAQKIERQGWVQTTGRTKDGKVCAAVALNESIADWSEMEQFANWLVGLGCNRLYTDVGTIAEWNDAPERTVEEVLLYLRKAGEELT